MARVDKVVTVLCVTGEIVSLTRCSHGSEAYIVVIAYVMTERPLSLTETK